MSLAHVFETLVSFVSSRVILEVHTWKRFFANKKKRKKVMTSRAFFLFTYKHFHFYYYIFIFREQMLTTASGEDKKKPLVEPIFCNCFTIKISSSSFTSYCPICIVLNSYASSFYINPCPIMEAIEEKIIVVRKSRHFFVLFIVLLFFLWSLPWRFPQNLKRLRD